MAHAELDISSEPSQLSGVRAFVGAFCRDAHIFDEDGIGELVLAVNEAVANIIRHAHRSRSELPIHIRVDSGAEEVTLRFIYGGDEFNPADTPPPAFDGSREGGFGLYMIARSVDRVLYSRDDVGRNCMCLIKSRPHTAPGKIRAE
jgi:anti-sigma regulatory factor (Ser/Thr protein kinase)